MQFRFKEFLNYYCFLLSFFNNFYYLYVFNAKRYLVIDLFEMKKNYVTPNDINKYISDTYKDFVTFMF